MLKTSLAVVVLFQAIGSICAQGVSVELSNGEAVLNFQLLGHSEIDDPLVCRTDSTSCCRGGDNPNGGGFGNWHYPGGGVVAFSFENLPSGQIYRMQRANQSILLRRNGTASTTTANGLYRCEVADQNGVTQTRYVGLYSETGLGVVSISEAPQFSLTSEDPLEFTLNSTTTGGPPTTAFWTLPNTATVIGDQELLNGVNGIVRHTLTVTERMTGVYMFSTTNLRSGALDTSSITVQAANAPTGLMAVQDSPTSILVSWTAPASGGATVTGYRTFYQTGGGSEQSVDVAAGATSHILTGLQSGATYSISIEARSNQLSSARVGPEMVTFIGLEAPTVMTSVLGPTSIRVTFTQPSGSLAADSYDIQYTRVTGARQTLCDSVEDTGTTTDVQSPFTITNLEEFSSYDITVTACVFSTTRTTTEQAMTSPAVPATAPRDLVSTTVLSTSTTVGWDPVECIERNGEIDNYIVRFGPEGGVQSESTVHSGGIDVAGTYTAIGLTPFTNYSFEVAAMNSADTGPFTATLIIQNDEDVPGPVQDLVSAQNFSTIVLVWNEPETLNGILIRYEVQYWQQSDPTNIKNESTGLNRMFILSNFTAGVIFTFNVTAFTRIGGGPSETIQAGTTPPVVQGVSVTVISDTAVNVSWTRLAEIQEITNYTVYYSLVSGGRRKRQDDEMSETFPATASSGFIDNLTPNVNYSFQVVAVAFFQGMRIDGVRPQPQDVVQITISLGGTDPSGGTDPPSGRPVQSCSVRIAGAVVGSSLATALFYTAILLPVILCWNRKKQLKYPVTSAIQPPAPEYAEVSTFKLPEKPGPIELEPNAAYGGVAVRTTAQAQVEEHLYEL